MAYFQAKKTFVDQRVGISVPSDPDFYITMSQNDKYSRDVADNYGCRVLALNVKTNEINANPNPSNYYEIFSGNVILRPNKYIRTTLRGSSVSYDNYENFIQVWTIFGIDPTDLWVVSSYTFPSADDSFTNSPIYITRTITTTSLGVTEDKEYPYTVQIYTGNFSPAYVKKLFAAHEGDPLQFSIEELGPE